MTELENRAEVSSSVVGNGRRIKRVLTVVFRVIKIIVWFVCVLIALPIFLLWFTVRFIVFKVCFLTNARRAGMPLKIALRM